MAIKNKKKRILCVLDSHHGELFNIIPMLHHWATNNELSGHHIDFIYIGHLLTNHQISEELSDLKKYINFKVYLIKIVCPKLSTFKKVINFLKLTRRILFGGKHYLTLIPYDQKYIFYVLMNLKKTKLLAMPHTTGSEVYSKGVFKDRKLRRPKSFPVLVKSPESEEYFNALGFKKLIVGGNYSNSAKYIKSKLINFELDSISRLCIFSLGRETKMFSEAEWINTHDQVISAAFKSGFKTIYFKMHPSQPYSDFRLISERFNNSPIEIKLIKGHPIDSAIKFDVFITILTSAGQHAIDFGKSVCCYATIEMRKQVNEFGNDPYPYRPFPIPEISEKKELLNWLNKVKKIRKSSSIKNEMLLSLNDVMKAF